MKTPQSVRELLPKAPLAHLTTLNSDGGPQVTVVWVGIENEEFVIGHMAAQPFRICLIAEQRQRDSSVASNVPDFLMRSHVADNELLVFYSDPDHGDLWAAV